VKFCELPLCHKVSARYSQGPLQPRAAIAKFAGFTEGAVPN